MNASAENRSSDPTPTPITGHCVVAQYNDEQRFKTALEVLEKADFSADEISVVRSAESLQQSGLKDAEDREPGGPPKGKTVGISTVAGGVLGGVLGTMSAVGPLLVAGPLVGLIAGAAGGGILASIQDWGVDPDVVENYEQAVRDGADLIIVSGDEERIRHAANSLKTTRPDHVRAYSGTAR